MGNNYDEYRERLERAISADNLSSNQDERIFLPPESDVALRHELITPGAFDDLISKALRTGNFSPFREIQIKTGCFFLTYIQSFMKSFDLEDNTNMKGVNIECMKDVGILSNISVSAKGYLVDAILTQKKKIGFGPEKNEKRGFLSKDRGNNE